MTNLAPGNRCVKRFDNRTSDLRELATTVKLSTMKTTAAAPIAQRLARNLDLIRRARQLDTEAFCRESGVSRRLLSLWRTGKHSPTVDSVGEVAERIGLDAAALLAREPSEVLRGEG